MLTLRNNEKTYGCNRFDESLNCARHWSHTILASNKLVLHVLSSLIHVSEK